MTIEAFRVRASSRLAAIALISAGTLTAAPADAISCTISLPPMAFGNYDAISKARVSTQTTMTVTCTGPGTLNYNFTLSPGQSGNQTARYLAKGANRLSYQVYLDVNRAYIFGDGTGGTQAVRGSRTLPDGNVSDVIPLFGSITPGQNPVPGTYTDTVTVLLTY